MLSFGMECENQTVHLTDIPMGIDLGVKELAVVAFGDQEIHYQNINKTSQVLALQQQIKHLQRCLSRKYRFCNRVDGKLVKSNNILKLEAKLLKKYWRLRGIRNNYLHQTTHALVELLPSRVVMEDLNIAGMLKNKCLSRAVGEQCFRQFIRQMEYKCQSYGIEFVQAPRFFPSSKTCSNCGSINRNLKLRDRIYNCPNCGLSLNRDYNAAINLMLYH